MKIKKNYVILLHGILKSSKHMKKIEKYLEQSDYTVINISYDYKKSISDIADYVYSKVFAITKNSEDEQEEINFVTHSLGGLIVRELLNKYKLNNLEKVIQIAPPNHGSEVASFLKDNYFYKKYCGIAGQELVKDNSGIMNKLGAVNYELGVIAGNKSNIFGNFLISDINDGRVSTMSTKVEEMKDYIELDLAHNELVKSTKIFEKIELFLRYGYFEEKSKDETRAIKEFKGSKEVMEHYSGLEEEEWYGEGTQELALKGKFSPDTDKNFRNTSNGNKVASHKTIKEIKMGGLDDEL